MEEGHFKMDVKGLLEKKSDLERRKERLIGKLETARENLSKIDARLREKGVDPDSLESEILRLKKEQQQQQQLLASALEKAEEIITRIEGRVNL